MGTMSAKHFKKKHKRLMLLFITTVAVTFLATSVGAKPTLPFDLGSKLQFPSFKWESLQQYIQKRQTDETKGFSGRRLTQNSLRMVYFHDLTVAVVELGPEKILLGCELIEVFSDEERNQLLKKLSRINMPYEIQFNEMIKLMYQCELIEGEAAEKNSNYLADQAKNDQIVSESRASIFPTSESISLFSGIVPGTKWCGTGDIAKSYHDLGNEVSIDKCCRSHDLCPSKVRGYQSRYNLDNKSLYTKSHCICDDMFYSCLKHSNSSAGNVLGTIYFNVIQVPCIEETPQGHRFREARSEF